MSLRSLKRHWEDNDESGVCQDRYDQGIVVQPKLVVPKGATVVVEGVLPSFRTLMADEVRGTPLQALWTDVLAAV